MIAGTKEWLVAAVFRGVVKGEPGFEEPGQLKSMGLFDKGASLKATNKGTKSPLLAMVSLA